MIVRMPEERICTARVLVAVERDGAWTVALLQNTPAEFHGRPDEVEKPTAALRYAPSQLPAWAHVSRLQSNH
jgi:hypothetical protein